jgi:uncharacterized membrane protein
LRTVRGSSAESEFVPLISVTVGVALAILSIGVLIFFVHHAAESIQSSSIVAAVGVELDRAVDRMYPDMIGEGAPRTDMDLPERTGGIEVTSRATGYVQLVEGEELLRIATAGQFIIEVLANPGVFVRSGQALARIYSGSRPDPEASERITRAYVIGAKRTATEDIEFLFRQLTEIAVRALSPGINDPFTAVECVDRLGAALQRLAGREIPSPVRRDTEGKIRVIAHPQTFTSIARLTLGSIRRYGSSHAEVLTSLLQTIGAIGHELRREQDRAVLLEEAHAALAASTHWADEPGKRRLEHEYTRVVRIVAGASSLDSEGGQW